jgi:hypothetical protein
MAGRRERGFSLKKVMAEARQKLQFRPGLRSVIKQ